MYDVPKEYTAAIRAPTRSDRMAGKLILTDGSTIELTDSAVISGSVSVDNQCVSGQELAFGSVYMGQASLQLRTALSSAAFYDAALQIDYEIQLADGSWYTLPVVLVWYIFTELGSIAENGAAMGAPVPSWLLSLLAESKEKAAK